MGESFELPVIYLGDELIFPAEFLPMGLSYKIRVIINGTDFLFEPDEEKNYRAVADLTETDRARHIKPDLLEVISKTLHELFS